MGVRIDMIAKIKDIMKTKENIDEINSELKDSKKEISSLRTDISTLKDDMSSIKKNIVDLNKKQSEVIDLFEKNIGLVQESRKDFEKEIIDFKTMKGRVLKDLTTDMMISFKKELQEYTEKIKKEVNDYETITKKMIATCSLTDNVNSNLNKLAEIVKSLKKEDFELTKFANKILSEDKNKLELMKKIDNLEHLISKMRRTQR